jgi:DnaK suppressor protein
MNLEEYRQRLVGQEQKLAARVERAMAGMREPGDGAAHDVGDDSSTAVLRDEQFAEADADRLVLTQVRDALKRIADGTFGACVVDGGPIEADRLEAMPWTPYCMKHQRSREQNESQRTPTL